MTPQRKEVIGRITPPPIVPSNIPALYAAGLIDDDMALHLLKRVKEEAK